MKKIIVLTMAAVIMTMSFTACSSKDRRGTLMSNQKVDKEFTYVGTLIGTKP